MYLKIGGHIIGQEVSSEGFKLILDDFIVGPACVLSLNCPRHTWLIKKALQPLSFAPKIIAKGIF